jgi:UDP-glucose 4-epimerase
MRRTVMVTGADGYVGRLLVRALAQGEGGAPRVLATDLRLPPVGRRLPGVDYAVLDVTDPTQAGALMKAHGVSAVVHLAAVVTPKKGDAEALLHRVDVEGTRHVLEGCVQAGVDHLVVTSSGAAYGYHADNPIPLTEDARLRGNDSFPYSKHKRIVEELLADYRAAHPGLAQLVLRPGTILGRTTRNQITALFEKPWVLGLDDADSPFVVIWDEDVVGAILWGLEGRRAGLYNLAGDGWLTLREMAAMMKKPYVPLPSRALETALSLLSPLGLTQYGPEQVDFLRYRPVLDNRRLKEDFGYVPRKTSREAFEHYLGGRGAAAGAGR